MSSSPEADVSSDAAFARSRESLGASATPRESPKHGWNPLERRQMSNLLWRTKPAEPASHYLGGEAGRRCAEGGGRSAGRPAGLRRRGAPRSTPWPPCRCTSSLLSLRLKRFWASRSLCGVLAMRCYGPKWNGYCARRSRPCPAVSSRPEWWVHTWPYAWLWLAASLSWKSMYGLSFRGLIVLERQAHWRTVS